MTSPKPMRIEELLELAALDAYGLLDEYEAELYTRSFHHAPVAVQDEILRIQAAIASDQSALPADLPSPELRRRVLDAVARAIEEDARELAPLASIGQRFAINSAHPPAARGPLALSGQFWRAAALIMVGVSIVLAWFGAEARQRADEISRLALQNNTLGQLEVLLDPTFKQYIAKPNCRQHLFTNRAAGTTMLAAVYLDPADGSAFLLVLGAPTGVNYTLRAVMDDGTTESIESFATSTSVVGFRIENKARIMTAVHWEIVDADQRVVLRTA
jgi:hypothetical protein